MQLLLLSINGGAAAAAEEEEEGQRAGRKHVARHGGVWDGKVTCNMRDASVGYENGASWHDSAGAQKPVHHCTRSARRMLVDKLMGAGRV